MGVQNLFFFKYKRHKHTPALHSHVTSGVGIFLGLFKGFRGFFLGFSGVFFLGGGSADGKRTDVFAMTIPPCFKLSTQVRTLQSSLKHIKGYQRSSDTWNPPSLHTVTKEITTKEEEVKETSLLIAIPSLQDKRAGSFPLSYSIMYTPPSKSRKSTCVQKVNTLDPTRSQC